MASHVFAPLVAPLLPPPHPLTLLNEPFDELNLQRWREVEVKGRTHYSVEERDGSRSLKAHSQGGASILLSPFRFHPHTYEWLSWRWRVDQPVMGENLTRKGGSDASARVYVYFDTPGLPWRKRNIDYVWSTQLPKETVISSAFSNASKIIVVTDGTKPLQTWQTVSRNIKEDYRRCFGGEPPDVVAIGVMTDTDNTHSEAVAYFDDLLITRKRPPVEPRGETRGSWDSPAARGDIPPTRSLQHDGAPGQGRGSNGGADLRPETR